MWKFMSTGNGSALCSSLLDRLTTRRDAPLTQEQNLLAHEGVSNRADGKCQNAGIDSHLMCALVRAEQEIADAAASPQLIGSTCDMIQESSVLPVRKTGTNVD